MPRLTKAEKYWRLFDYDCEAAFRSFIVGDYIHAARLDTESWLCLFYLAEMGAL